MTDTLTPIHDELDAVLEKINEITEARCERSLATLDDMVKAGNMRQEARMDAFQAGIPIPAEYSKPNILAVAEAFYGKR